MTTLCSTLPSGPGATLYSSTCPRVHAEAAKAQPQPIATRGCSTSVTMDDFLHTRSRVVRFMHLTDSPATLLANLFLSPTSTLPPPVSSWTLRDDLLSNGRPTGVWVVFKAHEQASNVLAMSLHSPMLLVAPALESDLEPFEKLQRVNIASRSSCPTNMKAPTCQQQQQRSPERSPEEFITLSTNPPNPRTSFRVGDWICSTRNCATHNFGRNTTCISCGSLRTSSPPASMNSPHSPMFPSHPSSSNAPMRGISSPRFATAPNTPASAHFPHSPIIPHHQFFNDCRAPSRATSYPASPKAAHPLLTPSGRTFAVGGRVQNVSSDPLAPCVIFWPDNEPFPDQGQIRPSTLVGVAQPPILNTGNRGPISHQPGDWICTKCNYLNWRRRKVCQTCLPYAEGNGDSISAAVQNERIALLTSVLAQTQLDGEPFVPPQMPRSQSMTPPMVRNGGPFLQQQAPYSHHQPAPRHTVQRSQSQFELGSHHSAGRPIYQTSLSLQHTRPQPAPLQHHQQHAPLQQFGASPQPYANMLPVHAPAPMPFLPAFLQDIVHSPSLSPASSSSAELSSAFESDADDLAGALSNSLRLGETTTGSGANSAHNSPLSSIWKFDGEESKSLHSLSYHSSRSSSLERPSATVAQK